MYQNWKIMRAGQEWEVVLLNIGSGLYVQLGDMRLTFGENPTIFYAIEQDGGLVGFQVPKGPTWDLRTGEPGEEVALVNNAGDFTEDRKWSPEPAWN
ncbi:hypothetical protein M405DRAFT_864595 [Rhizopogon salebrosus TDB-379]|nr:hypothetical protein M405DRAFT_864595 [Rhizopogon salebrosus TDB-379]